MIRRISYLYCDGENCPLETDAYDHAAGSKDTAADQRRRAAIQGWKRVGGRDLCPACYRKLKGTKVTGKHQTNRPAPVQP